MIILSYPSNWPKARILVLPTYYQLIFAGSSSPDECGYISNTANKGSSLSTPPTVRSTPSSEALDVVADLRYEAMRFRSLPHSSRPLTLATSSRETNGNHLDDIQDHAQAPASAMSSGVPPNMSIPLVGLKHFQPMILNGNTNNTSPRSQQHNIEDMYAKVSHIHTSIPT